MHTRVKLLGGCRCRPHSNYWGGYSQIIGGIYSVGCFKIVPLSNFTTAQQISDEVLGADYEFDIVF